MDIIDQNRYIISAWVLTLSTVKPCNVEDCDGEMAGLRGGVEGGYGGAKVGWWEGGVKINVMR